MSDRQKLLDIIRQRSFREKGAFKLASGRMSTIYFNLKPTMLDPEGARLIGAALAASLRRGGLLVPVLILPLTIPVLIFGVAASHAALAGPVPFGTPFTILCALSLASLVIGPVAAAAALRHAD